MEHTDNAPNTNPTSSPIYTAATAESWDGEFTPPTGFAPLSDGEHTVIPHEIAGHGAYGTVYKAMDVSNREIVAAKHVLLTGELAEQEQAELQARDDLLMKLDHPAIVKGLYSFNYRDSHQLLHYVLAMEWLEGRDGRSFIDEIGALNLSECIRIFAEWAEALGYAADCGICHRDLKPSNIFICNDGKVKILDFGLANAVGGGSSSGANLPGAPGYIAPERFLDPDFAKGNELTDVFSFGITLYEMITASHPFPVKSKDDVERRVADFGWANKYDDSTINFDHEVFRTSPELRNIIFGCLRKSPKKRIHTFAALAKALRSLRQKNLSNRFPSATAPTEKAEDVEPDEYLGNYRIIGPVPTVNSGNSLLMLGEPLDMPGERVVLKILRPNFQDPGSVRLFRQEGEILEKLSACPHIVHLFNQFQTRDRFGADQHVLVMEYIEGESLEDRLNKVTGGIEPLEAFRIFLNISEALKFSHSFSESPISHRDIKPANIVMEENGGGRLIDFGISHVHGRSSYSEAVEKGTWDYVAPDYFTCADFHGDSLADIYSFGVSFFRSLTGEFPYDKLPNNPTAAILAFRARIENLNVNEINFRTDCFRKWPEIKNLVKACLEPERSNRLNDLSQVSTVLSNLLEAAEKQGQHRTIMLKEEHEGWIRGVDEKEPGKEYRLIYLAEAAEESRASFLARLQRSSSASIVLPLRVEKNDKKQKTYAVFDPGLPSKSASSVLSRDFAAQNPVVAIQLVLRAFETLGELHLHDSYHGAVNAENLFYRNDSIWFGAPIMSDSKDPSALQAQDIQALANFFIKHFSDLDDAAKLKSAKDHGSEYCVPPLQDGYQVFALIPQFARIMQWAWSEKLECSEIVGALRKLQTTPFYGSVVGGNRIVKDEHAAYSLEKAPLTKRYEFIQELDKGGCGAVFKVRRLSDGQTFALKVPHEQFDQNRFDREVKMQEKLSRCPYVVNYEEAFTEVREMGGHKRKAVHLVMEFLDGFSLRQICKAKSKGEAGSIDDRMIVKVFHHICVGLAFCHQNKIIHRDIKPSNLYLDKGANPKMLDFGIARDERGTMTSTGRIPGTLEYMAPEVGFPAWFQRPKDFRGDIQSDIFALGLCLYEAFTRSKPFNKPLPRTKNLNKELFAAFRQRCEKLRDCGGIDWFDTNRLPTELAAVIRKALAPQPEKRFASSKDFGEALAEVEKNWETLTWPAPTAATNFVVENDNGNLNNTAGTATDTQSGTTSGTNEPPISDTIWTLPPPPQPIWKKGTTAAALISLLMLTVFIWGSQNGIKSYYQNRWEPELQRFMIWPEIAENLEDQASNVKDFPQLEVFISSLAPISEAVPHSARNYWNSKMNAVIDKKIVPKLRTRLSNMELMATPEKNIRLAARIVRIADGASVALSPSGNFVSQKKTRTNNSERTTKRGWLNQNDKAFLDTQADIIMAAAVQGGDNMLERQELFQKYAFDKVNVIPRQQLKARFPRSFPQKVEELEVLAPLIRQYAANVDDLKTISAEDASVYLQRAEFLWNSVAEKGQKSYQELLRQTITNLISNKVTFSAPQELLAILQTANADIEQVSKQVSELVNAGIKYPKEWNKLKCMSDPVIKAEITRVISRKNDQWLQPGSKIASELANLWVKARVAYEKRKEVRLLSFANAFAAGMKNGRKTIYENYKGWASFTQVCRRVAESERERLNKLWEDNMWRLGESYFPEPSRIKYFSLQGEYSDWVSNYRAKHSKINVLHSAWEKCITSMVAWELSLAKNSLEKLKQNLPAEKQIVTELALLIKAMEPPSPTRNTVESRLQSYMKRLAKAPQLCPMLQKINDKNLVKVFKNIDSAVENLLIGLDEKNPERVNALRTFADACPAADKLIEAYVEKLPHIREVKWAWQDGRKRTVTAQFIRKGKSWRLLENNAQLIADKNQYFSIGLLTADYGWVESKKFSVPPGKEPLTVLVDVPSDPENAKRQKSALNMTRKVLDVLDAVFVYDPGEYSRMPGGLPYSAGNLNYSAIDSAELMQAARELPESDARRKWFTIWGRASKHEWSKKKLAGSLAELMQKLHSRRDSSAVLRRLWSASAYAHVVLKWPGKRTAEDGGDGGDAAMHPIDCKSYLPPWAQSTVDELSGYPPLERFLVYRNFRPQYEEPPLYSYRQWERVLEMYEFVSDTERDETMIAYLKDGIQKRK